MCVCYQPTFRRQAQGRNHTCAFKIQRLKKGHHENQEVSQKSSRLDHQSLNTTFFIFLFEVYVMSLKLQKIDNLS